MPRDENYVPNDALLRAVQEAENARGWQVVYGGEKMFTTAVWFHALRIDGVEYGPDQLRDIVRAAVNVIREGVSADGTLAQITEHMRLVQAVVVSGDVPEFIAQLP